jgi:hypothetical protein
MSNKIGFVINSHIGSYIKTYKSLIDDFRDNNINLNDVFFYVGGFDEKSNEELDSLIIRKVNHNSIDFTGIISLLEDNIQGYTHFFFLHDTIKLGKNFYDNIKINSYDNARLTSDGPSMNMGILSKEYINLKVNEIFSMKNSDYSIDSINKFKSLCVILEDLIFKDIKESFNKSHRIVTGPIDYYNTGTLRIVEYYPDIDLYKIKANWFVKEKYETKL